MLSDAGASSSRAGVPDTSSDGQRAWIFRIARNLAINHVRDRRRHGAVVELIDVQRPATQELALSLDHALASLGELDREVFLLRESAGLTYGEIASEWRKDGGKFVWDVEIPANTTATVTLPAGRFDRTTLNGQPLVISRDIRVVDISGTMRTDLGSGKYRFVCE